MHRNIIRIISFVCGLGVITVGFAVSSSVQARQAEQTVHQTQVRALTDAVGHLEAMAPISHWPSPPTNRCPR